MYIEVSTVSQVNVMKSIAVDTILDEENNWMMKHWF